MMSEEGKGEWFRKGLRTIDEFTGRNAHLTCPRIVTLGAGESRRLVVFDRDASMVARLHRLKIGDVWTVVPCNDQPWAPTGECVLCKKVSGGKLRAPLTVLDVDGYVSQRTGRAHKYIKSVYLADDLAEGGQESALEFFRRVLDEHGILRGTFFVARQGAFRPGAVGDEFRLVKMLPLDDERHADSFVERWQMRDRRALEPYAYERFVRPMDDEAMRAVLEGRPRPHPKVDPGVPVN